MRWSIGVGSTSQTVTWGFYYFETDPQQIAIFLFAILAISAHMEETFFWLLRNQIEPRLRTGENADKIRSDEGTAEVFSKDKVQDCGLDFLLGVVVKSSRPRVEPIRQPTLFEMEKSEKAADDRPYSLPGILLGTSAFTAAGWEGSFYPRGMQSRDFLSYYATQFATVEVDSTFYGCPSASTVNNWYARTPEDFIFSVKVPQVITHEKVLVDCDSEFEELVKTMDILGPKLGPMVFQFPLFHRWKFPKQESFLAVLVPFLKKLPTDHKFVIEIRNKTWLDARFADLLREYNVALALTDTSFVPRPWEMKEKFDLITADFAYVRWLGDRKQIEKQTTTWDKTVIDRTCDLRNWVDLLREMVMNKKLRKLFAFANNHYAGHGPATAKLFMDLWNRN